MRLLQICALVGSFLVPSLATACLQPTEPLCLSPQFADGADCESKIQSYRAALRFYHSCLQEESYQQQRRTKLAEQAAEEELRKAKEEVERQKREAERLRAYAAEEAYKAKVTACRARGGTYC